MSGSEDSFEQRWARVLGFVVPCVCHKLNNSLIVVTGTTEMLKRRADPERLGEQLALVLDQGNEAGRQLKRLTTVARLSGVRPDSVDAALAVEDVAGLLGPVLNVAGANLELREPAGALPCRTDRQRLTQVLLVLAVSALLPPGGYELDAMRKLERVRLSGRFALSTSARPGGVVLRVSHPRAPEDDVEHTAALVRPTVAELGGRLETRCVGGSVAHRLALPALDG